MTADNRDTPRRIALASATVEENGNGHDVRAEVDDRPFVPPRNPLEIAANCAYEAKAAALQMSGMSGEFFREAATAKRMGESAIEAVGALRSDMTGQMSAVRGELSTIARAVGAKRTYSGSLHLSLPPSAPMPPTKVDVVRQTGEHMVVAQGEIDRLVNDQNDLKARVLAAEQRAAISEAEERGAREYAEKLEEEKVEAQGKADRLAKRNDRILKFVLAAPVLAAAIYGAGLWLVAHFH